MLCFEGIARMLNIFNRRIEPPSYKLHPLSPIESITVTEEVWICIHKVEKGLSRGQTMRIRPFASGAILRNVKFTEASFESFISLQDKLHQNLARQRTLVSMGTHD